MHAHYAPIQHVERPAASSGCCLDCAGAGMATGKVATGVAGTGALRGPAARTSSHLPCKAMEQPSKLATVGRFGILGNRCKRMTMPMRKQHDALQISSTTAQHLLPCQPCSTLHEPCAPYGDPTRWQWLGALENLHCAQGSHASPGAILRAMLVCWGAMDTSVAAMLLWHWLTSTAEPAADSHDNTQPPPMVAAPAACRASGDTPGPSRCVPAPQCFGQQHAQSLPPSAALHKLRHRHATGWKPGSESVVADCVSLTPCYLLPACRLGLEAG